MLQDRTAITMKRTLSLIILLITVYITAGAQDLSITSFTFAENDLTAMNSATRRNDQNGNRCALLKVETTETGLSFDTGMIGITDIVYHPGEVWIYVPKGTRKIPVNHARFGVLRDWQFPYPVESARTYILKLEAKAPDPVIVQDTVYKTIYVDRYVERVIERKVRAPRPRPDFFFSPSHYLWTSVGMNVYGGDIIDMTIGLGYAFVPGRVGGYVSYMNDFECAMLTAGPVFRLTGPRSRTEVQAYAGAGVYGGYCASADLGMRFAFGSRGCGKFNLWDLSVGCSYADQSFYPYVSVSIGISGFLLLLAAM